VRRLQLEARHFSEYIEKTMNENARIAPPYSVLLIAEAPTDKGTTDLAPGSRIGATPFCIAFGCLMYQDGETEVTLGRPLNTNRRPAFDGILETPGRKVAVWTVEWDKVLETRVPTARTRVRIWTNHPTEPDEVHIGVGDGK
jgi:hypothetical protein